MNSKDIVVTCPWCNTQNTIPEQLMKETTTSIVRTKKGKTKHLINLAGIAEEIRKKVMSFFESPEDPNVWLDIKCINTEDINLGIHSFQFNIHSKEVRK